jgi:hypothetical protein
MKSNKITIDKKLEDIINLRCDDIGNLYSKIYDYCEDNKIDIISISKKKFIAFCEKDKLFNKQIDLKNFTYINVKKDSIRIKLV